MAQNYFGVRDGKNPYGHGVDVPGGVLYDDWRDCDKAVKGKSVTYKGFPTKNKALDWLTNRTFRQDIGPDGYAGPVVYTDGSGKPDSDLASWSAVHFNSESATETLKAIRVGVIDVSRHRQTNIVAEIKAAIEAVAMAQEFALPALIVHDYTGVSSIAEGDWDDSKHPIFSEWRRTAENNTEHIAGFYHVEGHTGVRGNEIADVSAWNARLLAEKQHTVQPKISS